MSRPLRARGLKQISHLQLGGFFESRPLRARGLKPSCAGVITSHRRRAPCGRVD